MQDRLISRKEFAELANISIAKLHNALRSTELDTPEPKKKKGFQFLYSFHECIEFLKENDLKKIAIDGHSYSTASEKHARPINKKMALQFIKDKTSKQIRDYLLICKKKREKA